jgi:tripartite-type tricarboxylate transporter receptor subunit TctC
MPFPHVGRCGLAALSLTTAALPAAAQAGPIRLLVGSAPGSQPDIVARLVAHPLGAALGVPVVVDNRPGVAGNLGAEAALRARPDGRVLHFGTINNAINHSFFRPPAFDWPGGMVALAPVYRTPNVVVVHRDLPVRDLAGLAALARVSAGELNYASSGSGTSLHLAGEVFNQAARVRMEHVPYRAAAAAAQDLEAGRVQVMFDNLAPALARLDGGAVRALAVTSAERSARLLDVPGVAEAGFPVLEMLIWGGLFAPVAVPEPVLARLHAALTRVLAEPAMVARRAVFGSVPMPLDRAAFAGFVRAEAARWERVVLASGARPV